MSIQQVKKKLKVLIKKHWLKEFQIMDIIMYL